jgi:WD40 repeat protein
VRSIKIVPSNQYVIIKVQDIPEWKTYKINIITGSIETINEKPTGLSNCDNIFSCSPDGKSSVIVEGNGTIRIYHPDKEPTIILNGWLNSTQNIKYNATYPPVYAWSPNSDLLAISAKNGTIILISVDRGIFLKSLTGHSGDITGIKFSPDGSLLASTSYDGTVRLWGIP